MIVMIPEKGMLPEENFKRYWSGTQWYVIE
jgi:hypothetical protein